MSEETRWDVVYGPKARQCYIQPHFCREWDRDGGCYGTNPDHGCSFEEARDIMVEYYKMLAESIGNLKGEESWMLEDGC